jgi:hypothetical protein
MPYEHFGITALSTPSVNEAFIPLISISTYNRKLLIVNYICNCSASSDTICIVTNDYGSFPKRLRTKLWKSFLPSEGQLKFEILIFLQKTAFKCQKCADSFPFEQTVRCKISEQSWQLMQQISIGMSNAITGKQSHHFFLTRILQNGENLFRTSNEFCTFFYSSQTIYI